MEDEACPGDTCFFRDQEHPVSRSGPWAVGLSARVGVPDGLGGGAGGPAAFSRAVRPWASLQARKTYQVYHTESVNAEAKLREAERQEEKRSGRSTATAAAAAAAATAASAATSPEAGPLRKSSVKKGGRLVEKVGLGGTRLSPKALAPCLCLLSRVLSPRGGGPAGRAGSGGIPQRGWQAEGQEASHQA